MHTSLTSSGFEYDNNFFRVRFHSISTVSAPLLSVHGYEQFGMITPRVVYHYIRFGTITAYVVYHYKMSEMVAEYKIFGKIGAGV